MLDRLITRVILRYHPGWEPPPDKYLWNRTICPFHGDSVPSGAVNYRVGVFNCLACHVKGDAVSIIRIMEEVNIAEAKRIAKELSLGGDQPLPPEPPRKPSRRVFSEQGPGHHESGGTVAYRQFPTRVRRRTFGGA